MIMNMRNRDLFPEVEDEFIIRIPDHHASQLKTVGQLYKYVVRVLRKREDPNETMVYRKVVEVVAHVAGVHENELSSKDRLERLGVK